MGDDGGRYRRQLPIPGEVMARKRKTLLLALGGLMFLGVLAAATYFTLRPRVVITEETVAQIKPGMTEAEVEAILGGPARDYTEGRYYPVGPVQVIVFPAV